MPDEGEKSWVSKLRPGRPLLEAWIISAIIVSVSNVLAQYVDARQKEVPFTFDVLRWLRFLCLDLITAPINYKWQELLEATFPRHGQIPSNKKYQYIPLEERDVEKDSNVSDDEEDVYHVPESSQQQQHKRKRKPSKHSRRAAPKKNWKNIWTKWFIDCVTLGAIFNTVAFIVIIGLLNGQPKNIPHNLRTRTMKIIIDGYKIWPFANIIAQAFIPFERRIIFFAMVALFWNIYLSLVAAVL